MNGNGTIESLIKHEGSVKQEDFAFPNVGGGVFTFYVWPDLLAADGLPKALPIDPMKRQRTLLSTIRQESMWGSAVAICVAKGIGRGWEVEGNIAAQRERAHDILTYATAGVQVGYTRFMQHHLQGYTCNPFTAVELIRETKAYSSRVSGISHLPPARSRLTGDPETPLEFTDRMGNIHELKWWQVGIFSDMPDPDEDLGGAGVCAAERAYPHIRKLAAMERYVTDKVTGERVLALHFVSGVGQKQMDEAINSGKDDAKAKGHVAYLGALVIPSLSNDVSVVSVPLAELPDGFNRKEEFDITMLAYANALGLDPQDLQPLTGQSLGAGAQSQVLDDKAKGRGLNLWHRSWAEWYNAFVTPKSVTFTWYERDLRDEGLKADNMKKRGDWGKGLVELGTITNDQFTNILVDYGDLPQEFVKTDTTMTDDIADDEKPDAVIDEETGQVVAGAAIVPPVATGTPTNTVATGEAGTAVDRARQALNGAQVNAALDIVVKIATGELSYESGINALMLFFNLTEDEARRIIGNPDALVVPTDTTKAARTDLDALFDEELARAKRVAKAVV